jgi:hypothetical protein
MVKFNLAGAHPDYRRDIPDILTPLTEYYPGARLSSVSLYQPKRGDTSMGATYDNGEIRLNSHWFGHHPDELKRAAIHHSVIDVNGIEVGWHGPMVWEPRQLLTHEFGHVVWQSLPQREVQTWAADRWRAATRDPRRAPSGYALVGNSSDRKLVGAEFFGEMFALVHLGFGTDDEVADLQSLLGKLQ